MEQEPNQQTQNEPIAPQVLPPAGLSAVPPQDIGTPTGMPPAPMPPKRKSSKKFVLIIITLLILIAGAAAAYWFLVRKNGEQKSNNQTDTSTTQTQPETTTNTTDEKTWHPLDLYEPLSLVHGSTWSEKYWVGVKGIVKDVGGIKYLITFSTTPFNYDYMDRKAGGAYPPGTLYKTVNTAQGKTVHIGTFSFRAKEDGAFLSTCPLTVDGGCSIKVAYSDGSQSYWLVELNRYLPEQDNDPITLAAAKGYLDLSNPTDQQVLGEFAEMMSTLTY